MNGIGRVESGTETENQIIGVTNNWGQTPIISIIYSISVYSVAIINRQDSG